MPENKQVSEEWFSLPSDGTSAPEPDRLEGFINEYREILKERTSKRKTKEESWAVAAQNLLDGAVQALKARKFDVGWRYLLAARRMEVLGASCSDDQPDLQAVAATLRNEADDKLRAWRKESVLQLLPQTDRRGDIDRFALYRALEIRDEHFSNEYHKIRLRKTPLIVAAIVGCAATALVLILACSGGFPAEASKDVLGGTPKDDPTQWYAPKMLFAVTLFGIMGACLGAIR